MRSVRTGTVSAARASTRVSFAAPSSTATSASPNRSRSLKGSLTRSSSSSSMEMTGTSSPWTTTRTPTRPEPRFTHPAEATTAISTRTCSGATWRMRPTPSALTARLGSRDLVYVNVQVVVTPPAKSQPEEDAGHHVLVGAAVFLRTLHTADELTGDGHA